MKEVINLRVKIAVAKDLAIIAAKKEDPRYIWSDAARAAFEEYIKNHKGE